MDQLPLPLLCASQDASQTRDLGTRVAGIVEAGDVLLVSGDLGAGKTTFVQGLARGLGIDDPVTSPTFTLVRIYPCDPPRPAGQEPPSALVHVDVYRLDNLHEVSDLGVAEELDQGAMAAVEWGEAVGEAFAPAHLSDHLSVHIEQGLPEDLDRRAIRFEVTGPSWERRRAALAEAVAGRPPVREEAS